MAEPMEKTVIEAKEFVLKDADGNVSARLGTMPGEGPVLQLYSGGVLRLMLAVARDGPLVALADEAGKPVATLSHYEGGTALQLHTAAGNASMTIGAAIQDGLGLLFVEPDGKRALVVTVSNGTLHVSPREATGVPACPLLQSSSNDASCWPHLQLGSVGGVGVAGDDILENGPDFRPHCHVSSKATICAGWLLALDTPNYSCYNVICWLWGLPHRPEARNVRRFEATRHSS